MRVEYIILELLILVGMVPPSVSDLKTRFVDDKHWLFLLPSYVFLAYIVVNERSAIAPILLNVLLSIGIVIAMFLMRKRIGPIGGADFLMVLLLSPLSFIFSPSINLDPLLFPGILIYLLLTNVLGALYVLAKCIKVNLPNFKSTKGTSDLLKLLYTYKTRSLDETKEILIKKINDEFLVTPGIPLVTMGHLSVLIIFLISIVRLLGV